MTWECPICGLMNDDARDMCEDCGTPRPAGAVPAPSAPAPAVSAPEAPAASASGFAAAVAALVDEDAEFSHCSPG